MNWVVAILVSAIVTAVPAAASVAPFAIILDSWSPYYQPAIAIVAAGTPIEWMNPTASPHTIRHDGCVTGEECAFDSGPVAPDQVYRLPDVPPGRYAYHCELHPLMRGVLLIIE